MNDLTQQSDNGSSKVELNHESMKYLNETRKWAQFLSILGFVFIAIIVVVAFFLGTLFSRLGQDSNLPFSSSVISAIYLLFGLLYFFPIFYLYKFASHAKDGLLARDSVQMSQAFMNLKSHYKFMGIFMILVLGLYACIALATVALI